MLAICNSVITWDNEITSSQVIMSFILMIKDMEICSGVNEYFTLYIKIKMSRSLRFARLGRLGAFFRSSSYVVFLSVYIARNARSCILSSFLASDALQKCHTMWQYVRFGTIADLYSCSLACMGIIFLKWTRTPIFLVVFIYH